MSIIEEQVGWKCLKCNKSVLLPKDRLCGNCPSCGDDLVLISQGSRVQAGESSKNKKTGKNVTIIILICIIVSASVLSISRSKKSSNDLQVQEQAQENENRIQKTDSEIRELAKTWHYDISRKTYTSLSDEDYFYILKGAIAHFTGNTDWEKLVNDFMVDFGTEEIVTQGVFGISLENCVKENLATGGQGVGDKVNTFLNMAGHPSFLCQRIGAIVTEMISLGWSP